MALFEPGQGVTMTARKRGRRRTWARRVTVTAAVVFVAYVAFGFLAVPLIVRHVVVPRIGSQLNGSAAITRAAFNPFTFGIRLEDLAVADDAGRTLLGFQRFEGDLRLLATVFRSGYHFGPALLHEPMVRGDIAEDGSINLVTLFEPMLQQLEGEPAWRLPRVVVHELAVTDGRLEFSDVSLIEPFGLTMQGLQFTVEGLDTHPDHDNVHRLTASTASGAQVTWEGVIRVDPFTSRGTIRVTDLPLAQASPYVHTLTEGQVEGGRMAAELEYEFAPAAEPRVALVRVGEARIVELAVTRDQDPLLDVDQFVLTDVRLDAHSRVVEVAGIATTGTRLRIRREPSGQLDIQSLIRSDANATVDPGTLDATPVGTPAALAGDKGPISIAIDATRRLLEETRQTWTVRVEQMSVTDYAADVTDYGRVPPVELSLNMNRLLANDFGMTTGDRTIVIEDLTVVAPDRCRTGGRCRQLLCGEGGVDAVAGRRRGPARRERRSPGHDRSRCAATGGEGDLHWWRCHSVHARIQSPGLRPAGGDRRR
jgi:hypothetical protein